MTSPPTERLDAILARQMPDAEKRRRADVAIDTSKGPEAARREVTALIDALSRGPNGTDGG